jgi:hypothetical protein
MMGIHEVKHVGVVTRKPIIYRFNTIFAEQILSVKFNADSPASAHVSGLRGFCRCVQLVLVPNCMVPSYSCKE